MGGGQQAAALRPIWILLKNNNSSGGTGNHSCCCHGQLQLQISNLRQAAGRHPARAAADGGVPASARAPDQAIFHESESNSVRLHGSGYRLTQVAVIYPYAPLTSTMGAPSHQLLPGQPPCAAGMPPRPRKTGHRPGQRLERTSSAYCLVRPSGSCDNEKGAIDRRRAGNRAGRECRAAGSRARPWAHGPGKLFLGLVHIACAFICCTSIMRRMS